MCTLDPSKMGYIGPSRTKINLHISMQTRELDFIENPSAVREMNILCLSDYHTLILFGYRQRQARTHLYNVSPQTKSATSET